MNPQLDNVSVNAPIGVFDSGFGGLTVARAVADLLPCEDIVYLADSARAPYGPRPIAQVREYALQGLDHLAGLGVKALVIACNSASAAVLADARERYSIPVIEVVVPAAMRAATVTRNGRIGVICTQATAKSRAYDDALAAVWQARLYTHPCPRFVEFVEAGITSGPELTEVTREYLAPLRAAGIDTLILGCTHYPLLAGVISVELGERVALVSSADESARAAYGMLNRAQLLRVDHNEGKHTFLTTGDPEEFVALAGRLLHGFVTDATRIVL